MDVPTADDVRDALAALDPRQEKIVAALFTAMVQDSGRVRDQEWVSEQLTHVTLLAGGFEAESTHDGVEQVQRYLQRHAPGLIQAAFLLFQQVARDLQPRLTEGFTFEDALRCALVYLPSLEAGTDGPADAATKPAPAERNLGQQPLAELMAARGLQPRDLVAASSEQLTHKMVARAMKGRRLTANTMDKVVRAWNRAAGTDSERGELFDYAP